jgi:hypothetical protein
MNPISRSDWAKALESGASLFQLVATPAPATTTKPAPASNPAPAARPGAKPKAKVVSKAAKLAATKPAPKPAGDTSLYSSLPGLHVGRGYRFGNLDWFPVWTDAELKPRGYTTSFSASAVKVSEKPKAEVAGLQIENSGSTGILLLEGTLLEGGWQHRALTRSVFVDANQALDLPVVCVEQGRWAGTRAQAMGQKLAPARVRAAMRGMHKFTDGVQQASADQGKVWEEIHRYQAEFGAANPTGSYVAMRDDIDRKLPVVDAPVALAGQRGVIVAINGQPVALELFDHPDTLAERLEAILRGYLPDSVRTGYVVTPSRRARRFADRVVAIGVTEQEGPNHKRNKPDLVVAAEALFNKDELMHLAALNARHSLVLAA